MNRFRIVLYQIFALVAGTVTVSAQEHTAPVNHNPFVRPGNAAAYSTFKTTALTLPFFEDFTNYDAIPDTSRWDGRQVYVNNTMCVAPVSRGVATFDGLSQFGKPYDTISATALRYADSLTSKVFDLSVYAPGDSIYLSFFYQPQGNGFAPERQDSLMLFFRKKGSITQWIKVWSASDTANKPFRQVMIPVTDTNFLHDEFRFRFVNKVTMGTNDDVWNLDYIRMNSGRTRIDTPVNDIAYNLNPGFLLNDYTYMPYRQFMADPGKERAANFGTAIRNNYKIAQPVNTYGYTAREKISGAALAADSKTALSIGPSATAAVSFPVYTATVPLPGAYDKVIFENRFYLNAAASGDKTNDTIIHDQVFDNYLAYDDGTAELSYFLNLFPTLPGKIAVEHHLNQPDTLRGVAIYFGRQVPLATGKYFSAVVYKSIAYGGGTDNIIYEEETLSPAYRDTVNHYWIYKFGKPVPMPAGTFFIGTTQPALSGSDSLYIGLDRNRTGANHAYFNVLNYWTPSLVDGALMIRPLLGQTVSGSVISELKGNAAAATVMPNPASGYAEISLQNYDPAAVYELLDISGRMLMSGAILSYPERLDISALVPGVYLLKIQSPDHVYAIQKLIKQ